MQSPWKGVWLGPWWLEYRSTASSRLPELLDSLKKENLCFSLLVNPQCQSNAVLSSEQPSTANLPVSVTLLHAIMLSFRSSGLELTTEKAHEIERATQRQYNTSLGFCTEILVLFCHKWMVLLISWFYILFTLSSFQCLQQDTILKMKSMQSVLTCLTN